MKIVGQFARALGWTTFAFVVLASIGLVANWVAPLLPLWAPAAGVFLFILAIVFYAIRKTECA